MLVRFIKRFAILVPGIVVTYFVVSDIYPVIDRRFPAAVAMLLTYILIAYVLIPGLLRLIRIFLKPTHIPLYCVTPDGFASDPINIGIVGTEKQLVQAMTMAGWYQADKRTLRTLFRMGISLLLKQPYPTAPFSNLYLFGRSQDIGFQLPFADNPSHRHHVRFWAVKAVGDVEHSEHVNFWQKYHITSVSDRVLWVGAASRDVGIAPILHNAQLTHLIHFDTDAERKLIVAQVKKTGMVKMMRKIKVGKPYRLRNRVFRGYFKADGTMTILELEKASSK